MHLGPGSICRVDISIELKSKSEAGAISKGEALVSRQWPKRTPCAGMNRGKRLYPVEQAQQMIRIWRLRHAKLQLLGEHLAKTDSTHHSTFKLIES